MSTLLPALALIAYVVATSSVLLRFFHPSGPNYKITFGTALIGLVLHVFTLTSMLFTEQGQNFSLLNVSSLVCWLITVSVTITALSTPTILLLPVVYSFAALMQLAVLLLPHSIQIQHFGDNISLLVHIMVAFIAYAILIMATLYSFQVHYISNKLKQKNLSMLNNGMPPLIQAEALQFRLLLAGTILLGLTLLSGVVFTDTWLTSNNLHKNVLSSLGFLVFLALCWGHARLGWRDRTAVSLSAIGSILLTLGYFGSRFVKEVILGRF